LNASNGFILIKPHAVAEGLEGQIKAAIASSSEHSISVTKRIERVLGRSEAECLYARHKDADYYPWLIKQITSGPVVMLLYKGENTPVALRALSGPTKPEKARLEAPESIRARLTRPDETFERSRAEKRAVDNVTHTPDPDEIWICKVLGQGKKIFLPLEEAGEVSSLSGRRITAVQREGNIFFPEAFPLPC